MADVLPSDELIDEPSDYGSQKPGQKLGRYELLVPIARGGMARVWAARLHGQRGFQKLVAIKTILPHLAEEAEFERMFLDEARIASGVHHPNVCEIYELGEEKHTLYLAMEWVSGDSFARVLRASGKTEAVDPRVAARVVADASAGLHAAHELTDDNRRSLGVVHRDLSPHNILLTADGTAKVADFGVAKAMGQLHEATSAGQLKGKIAYMAPEQVTGAAIDRRSDVFSLGVVLYEATTGQRPFRGDGDHQVMHAVLKGEYAPPSSFLRGYPQELERIVARALSPQPILRYPTAERMRFALEEFLARGQLVTQSNVAQTVRARIGEQIERRRERIRQASSAGDREGGWSEPPGGGMTPSNQRHDGQRSGVKPSGAHAAAGARPLYTTMAIDRPPMPSGPPLSMAPLTPPMGPGPRGPVGAASSATIPQAPPHSFAQTIPNPPGHTPVSFPGAAYSQSGPSRPAPAAAPGGSAPPPLAKLAPGLAQTSLMPPILGAPSATSSAPPGSGRPREAAPQQYPMLPPQQQQRTSQGATPPPPAYGPSGSAPFDAPAGLAPLPDATGSHPPAGAGQYVLAAGVGVLIAAFIGVGAWVAWRGHRASAGDPGAVTAPTRPAAPLPASSSSPGTGPEPISTVVVAPPSAEIVFRIVPAEARLSVEGRDLADDVHNVPRPAMGKTVTVVAHATGHEDTTILVDYFTTSPMELTLKPAAPEAANKADPAAPVTAATAAAPAEGPTADRDPPKDPPKKKAPGAGGPSTGLPANPY